MKIILGSQSKWRRELLARMGYQFDVMTPDIDEKAIRDDDAWNLTLRLAHAKADALLPCLHLGLLITSDQVVVCDGEILEKPRDSGEARRYLEKYGKFPAETVTAVVVTNTVTRKRTEGIDVARVVFRPIPADVIDRLIEAGEILHHAGAFSLEDPLLEDYVERVDGEPESIMGLPREMMERLLGEVGG